MSTGKWLGVVGAVFAAGAVLDAQHRREGYESREFVEGSINKNVEDQLRTGDIILFDRNPLDKKLGKNCLAMLSKLASKTNFDHPAIVVRNREEDVPYVLEHTFTGVQLMPYDRRILHSNSTQVVLRRLVKPHTKEVLDELDAYVARRLAQDGLHGPDGGLDWTDVLSARNALKYCGRALWLLWAPMDPGHPLHADRVGILGELQQAQRKREATMKRIEQARLEHEQIPGYISRLLDQLVYNTDEVDRLQKKFDKATTRLAQVPFGMRAGGIWPVLFPDVELVVQALKILNAMPDVDWSSQSDTSNNAGVPLNILTQGVLTASSASTTQTAATSSTPPSSSSSSSSIAKTAAAVESSSPSSPPPPPSSSLSSLPSPITREQEGRAQATSWLSVSSWFSSSSSSSSTSPSPISSASASLPIATSKASSSSSSSSTTTTSSYALLPAEFSARHFSGNTWIPLHPEASLLPDVFVITPDRRPRYVSASQPDYR